MNLQYTSKCNCCSVNHKNAKVNSPVVFLNDTIITVVIIIRKKVVEKSVAIVLERDLHRQGTLNRS